MNTTLIFASGGLAKFRFSISTFLFFDVSHTIVVLNTQRFGVFALKNRLRLIVGLWPEGEREGTKERNLKKNTLCFAYLIKKHYLCSRKGV